ncbi:hypothetical protein NDU88_004453 [Pleurodeles waltl]|uniref:Uncharacterized protein n=1 Tax=Pleurodeles waltl TaxID=8319 RepID=A0AAV7V1G8_PLEWA|nr:hypothetical protein NDU88_004453 [Pleurodeles waltl]
MPTGSDMEPCAYAIATCRSSAAFRLRSVPRIPGARNPNRPLLGGGGRWGSRVPGRGRSSLIRCWRTDLQRISTGCLCSRGRIYLSRVHSDQIRANIRRSILEKPLPYKEGKKNSLALASSQTSSDFML